MGELIMPYRTRGLLALSLALPLAAAGETELEPDEAALLTARTQARRVADANEILDGLEQLSRYPEAARVLLQQHRDAPLLQALQAMQRPLKNKPPTPVAPPRTSPKVAVPKRRGAPLRVVGAWVAPVPKAIIIADGKHEIVYLGESFRANSTSWTLHGVKPRDLSESGNYRRYQLELIDSDGKSRLLDWPTP